jgi:hypothetical protein
MQRQWGRRRKEANIGQVFRIKQPPCTHHRELARISVKDLFLPDQALRGQRCVTGEATCWLLPRSEGLVRR